MPSLSRFCIWGFSTRNVLLVPWFPGHILSAELEVWQEISPGMDSADLVL